VTWFGLGAAIKLICMNFDWIEMAKGRISRPTSNDKWYYLIVKYYNGSMDCFRFAKPRLRDIAKAKYKNQSNVKSVIPSEHSV